MASDKSVNSNHTPPPVRVKIEPGTSMPVPLKNIKTEPGLSSTTTRLTSFRLPRDLTLGGAIKSEKPKKVYVPNLNAQRSKKKDDAPQVKTENARSNRDRDRGRGRGRGDRGRGRGSSNLIQSTGVWSEGITKTPGSGGRRYGAMREGSEKSPQSTLEKPKLDLNRTIDKAEEEEKIKNLLRDDFIDDGDQIDLDNAPVMLPMIEDGKLYKEEAKVKTGNEEEVDKKPIILENGEVLKPKKEVKVKVPVAGQNKEEVPTAVIDLVDNKTNSYILIQFPDCLPGLESSNDDVRAQKSNDPKQEGEKENQSKTEYCTLNSLKPGMLGKLQILRSGKARILLGENNLVVDIGSQISFRQDVIAAKVDPVNSNGDLINLGPIGSTLICSPDWESMLAKL